MSLEAKRRLLDLDVDEVSLVDKAANLQEFIIVKSQNGGTKTMFTKDGVPATEGQQIVTKAEGGDASEVNKAKPKVDTTAEGTQTLKPAGEEPTKKSPVKKSEDEEADEIKKALEQADALLADIKKAGAKMSKENLDKFQQAMGLLGELHSNVSTQPATVTKALEERIEKLNDTVEKLAKALEGVEGVRGIAKSLTDEGKAKEGDAGNEAKIEKGFWNGVL